MCFISENVNMSYRIEINLPDMHEVKCMKANDFRSKTVFQIVQNYFIKL